MKKLIILPVLTLFSLFASAQTAKDVNLVIQRMLDLHDLQDIYTPEEKNGEVPLLILTNGEIPQNLLVFKFNTRV